MNIALIISRSAGATNFFIDLRCKHCKAQALAAIRHSD
jgi:hypothetical protein